MYIVQPCLHRVPSTYEIIIQQPLPVTTQNINSKIFCTVPAFSLEQSIHLSFLTYAVPARFFWVALTERAVPARLFWVTSTAEETESVGLHQFCFSGHGAVNPLPALGQSNTRQQANQPQPAEINQSSLHSSNQPFRGKNQWTIASRPLNKYDRHTSDELAVR